MSYKYTHFIPQNVSPVRAKQISVYNASGEKVCSVPLGRLERPKKEKLYSFGLISDVHLQRGATSWKAEEKFPSALQYFKNQGCAFCVHCGDAVNYGFFHKNDSTGEIWFENDFETYDTLRKTVDIPIYGICGNHESYGKSITENIGDKTYDSVEEAIEQLIKNDMGISASDPLFNAVKAGFYLQPTMELAEELIKSSKN
jgi:hypothetical protein